ncbi:alanine racemase [Persephonella sp.]
MVYRSWAEIDSKRLIQNTENVHKYSKKDILAVVKADAYGHGSIEISRILENINYVKKLCVATAEEGKELREGGIKKEILVLGGVLKEELDYFNEYNLQPVISDFNQLQLLDGKYSGSIHLKFDTGMHRLGFYPKDINRILNFLKGKKLIVDGLMSHFPSADTDPELTNHQINQFKNIVDIFKKNGVNPRFVHIQNSAGLIYRCDYCNCVRVGISLYGEKPSDKFPINIKTVMSVKSKIISIKEIKKGDRVSYGGRFEAKRNMKIGIISFGYADGLPRELSNKGFVLVGNKKARIIGSVTMDMTIIDLSDIKNPQVDDTVLIVGKNSQEEISFNSIAKMCNTIPYEIMCRISKRVKRIIL